MEILQVEEAMLSNFEVLQLLREEEVKAKAARASAPKARSKDKEETSKNLATIEYAVKVQLDKAPLNSLTAEGVHEIMMRLRDYGLTKAEKLAMLNLRPMTELEQHLVIELSEERFTDEQLEELRELLTTYWPVETAAVKTEPASDAQPDMDAD